VSKEPYKKDIQKSPTQEPYKRAIDVTKETYKEAIDVSKQAYKRGPSNIKRAL